MNGEPGFTSCEKAQHIIASANACAMLAAVVTGPIAPPRIKGATIMPCPLAE